MVRVGGDRVACMARSIDGGFLSKVISGFVNWSFNASGDVIWD